MDLRQFVSTTLSQIVEGIVDAQKAVLQHEAYINPGNLMRNATNTSESAIWDNRTNNYARSVVFDVVLTVEEGTNTGAKIGVVAGVFNLGANGASENKQASVSRVQFTIPVLFPATALPVEARQPKP